VGFNVKKVATKPLYNYRWHKKGASESYRTGQTAEPDWLAWIPAVNGGPQPFASVASTGEQPSHPVREYDLPKVSIVIPVGDGHEELVGRAIESVVAQTEPLWELLVVDDTTDGDLPYQGEYPYGQRYPFIHWLSSQHHGVARARNAGAAAARGEYLCFLDADDTLERAFLKETLKVSEGCPDALLVYTDWFSMPDGLVHRSDDWDLSQLQRRALFAMTFVHPRQGWVDVGGFDESLTGWEDWDYTIKLGFAGYTGSRVKQPLLTYYYDTGTLRKESLSNKDQLLPIIYGKYDKVKPMPRRSCGCSKKKPAAVQTPVREERRVQHMNSRAPLPASNGRAIPPSPGFVLISFLPVVPARLFKTPSGTAYRWGGSKQTQWVCTEDATFFLKHPEFKELERS
jgi:glycosyltransferase involved in cell wall biosynthesis